MGILRTMKIKIPQGATAPQTVIVREEREGCFLQTLNVGCAVVVGVLIVVVLFVVLPLWNSRKSATPESVAPSTAPTQRHAVAPPESPWRIDEKRDEITDAIITYVSCAAEKPVGKSFMAERPRLVVRIKNKTLEGMEIFLRAPGGVSTRGLSAETAIILRMDDAPAVSEVWSASTDFGAAFSPDPGRLLKRLLQSRRLLIRYDAMLGEVHTCAFDLSGLDAAIRRATK